MALSQPSRRTLLSAGLLLPAGLLAACSKEESPSNSSDKASSGASAAASGASSASGKAGTVQVLYAGSLVNFMTKQVGPGFQKATGGSVDGFAAGSTKLASQIKGKLRKADVFISASPAADKALMGASNGDWVTWYATFATSALVLGYNPKSKFAQDIQSKGWVETLSMPGIKIGSTDPVSDPKGKLAKQALTEQGKTHPALAKLANDQGIVFPEETLIGHLQSGQLDAGFFYTSEAKAAGIPTVPLTGEELKATYTVTIPKNAPHQADAEAFVKYLLGDDVKTILKNDGFTVKDPVKVTGTGVPDSLKGLLHTS